MGIEQKSVPANSKPSYKKVSGFLDGKCCRVNEKRVSSLNRSLFEKKLKMQFQVKKITWAVKPFSNNCSELSVRRNCGAKNKDWWTTELAFLDKKGFFDR